MITLTETIEVPRSVASCFRYVADFRTTVEWDATAVGANKLTPGPIGQGTRFSVRCKAGRGHLNLGYEITEYTPWQCLTLEGRGRWFTVTDVITFEPLGDDLTRIHYVAKFTFPRGLQRLSKRLEPGFTKMGRASLKGLARALTDENPPLAASQGTQKRDAKLATALACFTRYGYRRGQKTWRPMTADMSDKHVVLTGANAGLGFATAVSLLEAGATLTVVVRDPAKAADMQQAFKAETGREADHVELADLSLLAAVSSLCERLHHHRCARYRPNAAAPVRQRRLHAHIRRCQIRCRVRQCERDLTGRVRRHCRPHRQNQRPVIVPAPRRSQ